MQNFEYIRLNDWRQFFEIDIDLSKQVTILTGPNGCGKTTILSTLSRHFGWSLNFVSTPFWGKKKTKQFWSDVRKARSIELDGENNEHNNIGTIGYDNGIECQLITNTYVNAQYQLQYQNQQSVIGLHIPSHRPPAVYHKVDNIPTNPTSAQQHYQNFLQLQIQTYGSGASRQNPGVAQKQSIMSLALFGYGNDVVRSNPEFRIIFEEFQEILRHVLPTELGFERLEVRMPEVVLVTNTGDFALDSMSGGINALFGMSWQIHMYGADKDKCTVTIDEPENHLHPSMQRSLLPSLAKAFPKYKFIIATHSPFIVSSFPESSIFGLTYNKDQRIVSEKLDVSDISGTPNKVLREILDVRSNLPIWVEEKIQNILMEHESDDPAESANRIMKALKELGIADSLSEFRWDSNDA